MTLDLPIALAVVGTACIVGILWWLYRRFRVRRKPTKDPKQ